MSTPSATSNWNNPPDHYVLETAWDNIGNGWRMHCNCGWCTIPERSLQNAGEDMDDHLRDFNAAPPDQVQSAKESGPAGSMATTRARSNKKKRTS